MSARFRSSKAPSAKDANKQIFLDIPWKFRDVVEPFLNKNLAIDVKVEGGKTVIVLIARKGTRGNQN